ncbi:phenylacetate--CoA ligase family protein [Winogradskyella flava]|uniref:phenylacetate--CoA ligase family protein n=1 Tax=Winogradskyella flava TaxID=1884876 RepID=UPI0024918796|nr:phenylacetate--CoA ligase family protein [Winogradskyella flava]
MRLFDFSLKFNGFDIDNARKTLSKIQALNDFEFNDYVEKKKKEIISYHLQHNPFYKSLGKTIDVDNWDSVPVMTKRHLQRPLQQRLSLGYGLKDIYINKTSGSSGDPFIFAKDKWCHAMTWAEIMDRFSWYCIDFNSSKQARFYGIPLDKKGYYKERVKDWFGNRFRFSVFDLSDEAFKKALKTFKSSKFEYINGYTSPIVQFAKYLKRKNVILNTICSSLRVCIVTSEMLFEDDKKLMETQFGVPVVNEYGASELDLIAFENLTGEWQVNSETLYVEVLDQNDNALPSGEEGRIVITSLYNKAHPFIRYDIGDIGTLSDKGSIRKPILEKLTGRTNDIAVLPSGKKATGLTFYYITKSVIEDDGNVSEFVIEQVALDKFMIRYISLNELSGDMKKTIAIEMEHYLEPGINVYFERVYKLERTKAGKLKQFVSNL